MGSAHSSGGLGMRWVAAALLTLVTHAAWAEEDAKLEREIEAFIREVQQAANARDRKKVASFFDPEEMHAQLERDRVFDSIPQDQRERIERGIRIALPVGMARNDFIWPFESFEIRRIHPDEGRQRVIAYVRSRDKDGTTTKARWYLIRRGETWRAYDHEDLDANLRISSLLGLVLADGLSGGILRWREVAQALGRLPTLILEERYDEAYALLQRAEAIELPAAFEALVQLALGAIEIDREELDSALERFDRAESLKADMPMLHYVRAVALNDSGRHAEALEHARRYVRRLDADAEVMVEMGRAQLGVGQQSEAIRSFEHALSHAPAADALAYLAMALPAARKGELAGHFAKLKDVSADYEQAAEICLAEKDGEALQALTALFKKTDPDHRDVHYYEGQALELEEKHGEAATCYARALDKLVEDELEAEVRPPYYDAYLWAMVEIEKPVEALHRCPDKAYAFRQLLKHYDGREHVKTLRALLDASKTVSEIERERAYVEASVDDFEGRHAEAARRAQALLEKLPTGEIEDEDEADFRDRVEERVIAGLVGSKQFEPAIELARKVNKRDERAWWLVYACAHQGDVEQTRKAIVTAMEQGYEAKDLFEDPALQKLLAAEAYQDLRKKYLGD